MQFWDSSALLPLVVAQRALSHSCRRLFEQGEVRAAAFVARIECRSALVRLAREGAFTPTTRDKAAEKMETLLAGFDVVVFSPAVERHALALLSRHGLRSLDAIQLASALAVGGSGSGPPQFVCCDRRLARAAAAEGLTLPMPST
jgi:predicted nucleic acid-binding protein